ncbi:MAG TPA: class I SAM-dependent methyltransferase [Anaerolineales bacterium]|nr:class I SAM-dependent methyltransferase [Anaerolineales bacterium]
MSDRPQTWHYGLVARYWAEHNTDGPEIDYFQKQVERYGQPALDAGCGTGRLLIPFLRAGLDVDGCDVSPDMLTLCQEKAENEGLQANLYQQALHELDLPRTYQTIVVCGAFGIGVSRQQDFVALQRFYQHLNPGGVLLLDNHMPYGIAKEWQLWLKESWTLLPKPWPDSIGKTPPSDGSDYELFYRPAAFDPLEQRITRQMRTVLWREGQPIADEVYTLYENIYFHHELRQMLEQAGFEIEAIQGGYTQAEATAEHDVIVFIARKQQ